MGSGLVYIIIVGMWISYFLPRWISSHDDVSGRSMERFAEAMARVGSTTGKVKVDVEDLKARHQNQLITRRILFATVSGFTFLVGLFILVGLISPVIMTIPISAFALYLVHARHQVQMISEEVALLSNAKLQESKKSQEGYSELIARSKRASRQLSLGEDEHWTPLGERRDRSESEISGITILPKGSAASNSNGTWQPTEIPAPTYSQAPKAAPRRRIIDLTIPGAWSSAHETPIDELALRKSEEVFDQEVADQMDEQLKRYRAANE